jgi:hypothetical protein
MKTKLTFLLALTFLFLFGGNSFGSVFDKTDESVVLLCVGLRSHKTVFFTVNMKDEVIKEYSGTNALLSYKITKKNDVYIQGIEEEKDPVAIQSIRITRHTYENHILLRQVYLSKKDPSIDETRNYECKIGNKKF